MCSRTPIGLSELSSGLPYSFVGESDPVGPPEDVRVRAGSPFDRLLERAEADFVCCRPVLQTPRDGAECERKLRDQIGGGDLASVEEGLAHCAEVAVLSHPCEVIGLLGTAGIDTACLDQPQKGRVDLPVDQRR